MAGTYAVFDDWAALRDALLVFRPHYTVRGVPTPHGPTEAVRADIVVLDGPGAGSANMDVLVLPRRLQATLTPLIGRGLIAGRLRLDELPGASHWTLVSLDAGDLPLVSAHAGYRDAGKPHSRP